MREPEAVRAREQESVQESVQARGRVSVQASAPALGEAPVRARGLAMDSAPRVGERAVPVPDRAFWGWLGSGACPVPFLLARCQCLPVRGPGSALGARQRAA